MHGTVDTESCSPQARPFEGGQFLSFQLAAEEYGLTARQVGEILGMPPLTPVPRTDDCVRGVFPWRGRIVPAIDLRRTLGMASAAVTADTRIVILDLEVDGEWLEVGCIADAVGDVVTIEAEDVAVTPRRGNGPWDCVVGLARLGDRALFLLDIERLFAALRRGGSEQATT